MRMVLQLSESETEEFVKRADFSKGGGLLPAIIQDASSDRVLMQGYMNDEALRLTLTKGKMHFWSRGRGRIWLKGEESGHFSLLENAILDCDNDAILFKVQQIGNICHTDQETCFHHPAIAEKERRVDAKVIERIFEIIEDRIKNPTEKSYVSALNSSGEDNTTQRIQEETTELATAVNENNAKGIVAEATDVLFHIMVLLAQKDIKIQEIFEELEKRHQAKTQYRYSSKD